MNSPGGVAAEVTSEEADTASIAVEVTSAIASAASDIKKEMSEGDNANARLDEVRAADTRDEVVGANASTLLLLMDAAPKSNIAAVVRKVFIIAVLFYFVVVLGFEIFESASLLFVVASNFQWMVLLGFGCLWGIFLSAWR